MAIPVATHMTVDEYLAFERASEERHEYIDGEVVQWRSANRRRAVISGNLLAGLAKRLHGRRDYEVFSGALRLAIPQANAYFYPHLSVTAHDARFEHYPDDDMILEPTLLVDVASPDSDEYELSVKWPRYRQIAALREYLVVDDYRVRVERFLAQDDGTWSSSESRDPHGVVTLESIGCELSVQEIYEGVDWASAPPRAAGGE